MPSERAFETLVREFSEALHSPPPETEVAHTDALEWLALVPVWPEAVAELGFPSDIGMLQGARAMKLLEELEQSGWVEAATSEMPWSGRLYRMSRAKRRSAIQIVRARQRPGSVSLLAEAILLSEQIRSARAMFKSPYPRVLREWCELLKPGPIRTKPDEVTISDRLGARVQEALRQAKELGLEGSPDVAILLDAAEPLAMAVGGSVRATVARCHRQLELYHRGRQDEGALVNYQEREELDRSLEKLVTSKTAWALHYIGVGGVGKTMFLRHLQSKLATRWNLATARVDFDYLNPNYPLWSPGLLLLSFAEELKLEAPDSAIDYFTKLTLNVNQMHERLEVAQRASRVDIKLGFDAEGFDFCLTLFVEALLAIERAGRRPLLILDTCEELARLRFESGAPRPLMETFKILEAIHLLSPSTRVVFSGRRPLAQSGPGWSWTGGDLLSRDYLLLRPILGFDQSEGLALLKKYRRKEGNRSLSVPFEVHEGILELSKFPQAEELAGLSIEEGPDAVAEARTRYNPYDLVLYAGWAAADATLTPEKLIKAGRHHYVRERIVARLREDVKAWLPNLTMLGRFDEELVGDITGLRDDDLANLWAEIRRQEWVNLDRGAIGTTVGGDRSGLTFWNIDRQIRTRLESFYLDEMQAAWDQARPRLADVLQRVTIEREWGVVTPSYFEVTAALLRESPVRAATWWTDVERKILDTGSWEWADRIVASLLAPTGPIGPVDGRASDFHPLTAPVNALRANVQMRSLSETDSLDSTWKTVARSADAYPEEKGKTILRFRAAAGTVAYLRYRSHPLVERYAHEFQGVLDCVASLDSVLGGLDIEQDRDLVRQVLHTAMAMFDNAVEVLERGTWTRSAPSAVVKTLLGCWNGLAGQLVAAQWLAPYLQRLRLLDLQPATRSRRVADGFRYIGEQWSWSLSWETPEPELLTKPAFDWLTPRNLVARRGLEIGRILEAAKTRTGWEQFSSAATALVNEPTNLDEDRLLSQALRLAGGFPTKPRSDFIVASIGLTSQREECQAHRTVPPLYVSAIQALAADGLIDEALKVLQDARSAEPSEAATRWLNSIAAVLNRRFLLAEPAPQEIEIPELPAQSDAAIAVTEFMTVTAANLRSAKEGRLSPAEWELEHKVARGISTVYPFPLPTDVDGLVAVPPGWRPWFARYLVIRVLAEPRVNEAALHVNESERTEIRGFLKNLYGSALPKDVAFLDTPLSPPAPPPKRELIYGGIGLGMLVPILYGFLQGAEWIAQSVFGRQLPWWQDLVLLVTGVIAVVLVAKLLKNALFLYLRRVNKSTRAVFSTVSLAPGGTYSAESTMHSYPSFGLRLRSNTEQVLKASGSLDLELSYLDAARFFHKHSTKSDLPRRLDRFMMPVSSQLRTNHDIVLTGTDPEIARPSWESVFGTLPRSTSRFSECPFEFRRAAAHGWETGAPFAGQMAMVSVSSERELGAWRAIVSGSRSLVGISTRKIPDKPDPHVGVLMIQAEASISDSGVRMAIDLFSSPFRPDDVARLFPNLRVLLLLGFDRSGLTPRTATDRVLAGNARRAAHELFRVAAPLVICIPGLPSRTPLADEALEIIAKVVATHPGNALEPMRSAVRRIQDRIFIKSGLHPQDATELAYDVCYFAADTVNLRVDLRFGEWQLRRGARA